MSGISGFCGFKNNLLNTKVRWTKILVDMRDTLGRRGINSSGVFINRNLALGHTNLVVKESVVGSQPIVRTINNKQYAIAFDGSLFNVSELKSKLTEVNFALESLSDVEVVLFGFLEHGADFVKEMNGVFAFAIWDGQAEALYLFRDKIGAKPLFYTFEDSTLVFGSEKKALFKYPGVKPKININSLQEIFGLGPARTAGNGVFSNINEIKPAHYGVFTAAGLFEERYWEFESVEHKDSYEETVEKVSYLVRDAIKLQTSADSKICSFLSGGLDSSIVTALASNYLKEKGKKLSTYSFDFEENDVHFQSNSFQPERDRPFVEIMLKQYDLEHTFLECDEKKLFSLLQTAVDAKDLPGMADIDASLLHFCSIVSRNHKVALTGECADEIFWGYPWFHKPDMIETDTFPWSKNIAPRTMLLNQDLKNKLKLKEYIASQYEDSIKAVPKLEGENDLEQRLREISYLTIRWFMQTLLDRMDRMSMFCGLEARIPFADYRIMEYMWNVPHSMKCKDGTVKNILREACKDLLPDELINRKKSPFPKIYNPKYDALLRQGIMDIISNNNSPIYPLLDITKVRNFLNTAPEYGKPWYGQLMATPQLMAYIIQINYWLQRYSLSLNF